MARPALVGFALLALAGCGPTVARPAPAPPAPAAAEVPAPPAPAEAVAPEGAGPQPATATAKPKAAPLAPRVDVGDVQGGDAARARAAYQPAADPIRKCSNGTAGVVRVRIQSDEKSTSMKVEDNTSLDAAMRRCVLEALSTVDIDDVVSRSSPSARSSGFSSLVTIAW